MIPAFAASSTADVKGSITVENPQQYRATPGAELTDSTYTAYKIFDVTYENGASGENDLYSYTIDSSNPWFNILVDTTTAADDDGYRGNKLSVKGLRFQPTQVTGKYVVIVDENTFSAPDFAHKLNNLTSKPTGTALTVVSGKPTASNLDLGYYFVTTTTGSLCNLTTTHPDELIYDKNEVPPLDKWILEDVDNDNEDEEIKNNNGAIGDEVKYEIKTKVPSMVGYDKYYYIVTDKLSKGLTLLDDNDHPFSVTIAAGDPAASYAARTLTRVYLGTNGKYYSTAAAATAMEAGTDITAATDSYYITTTTNSSTGETTFKLVFVNFIQYQDSTVSDEVIQGSSDGKKGYTDAAITITYTAQIDEDAVIGNAGNPNTVDLEYSNNPEDTGNGEGTPDEPKNPQGKTPESKTMTYVTEIELLKVDASDATKYLPGAKFTITATDLLNTVIETGVKYEKTSQASPYTAVTVRDPINNAVVAQETVTANKTFYKLLDGTYTETQPNDDTKALYEDNGTQEYVQVTGTWVTKKAASPATTTYEGITGTDGKLTFTGLKAGTYTITELIAPDGYNLLKDAITVDVNIKYVLTAAADPNPAVYVDGDNAKVSVACEWSADDKEGTGGEAYTVEDGTVKITVENSQGATLPSTGGIGTTIFYVAGSLMVLAAAILLITKRRMGVND